jgi:hypothetical protein
MHFGWIILGITAALMASKAPTHADPTDNPCLLSMAQVVKKAPSFGDFAVKSVWTARPVPVDLKHNAEARQFRTMLRQGAAKGPNFAGHYTIVGWGCGSSCLNWAIVDAKNGYVFFAPGARIVAADHVDSDSDSDRSAGLDVDYNALRFKRDSSLLSVLGAPEEDASREGIYFYQWTGKRLKLVSFFSRKNICSTETSRNP